MSTQKVPNAAADPGKAARRDACQGRLGCPLWRASAAGDPSPSGGLETPKPVGNEPGQLPPSKAGVRVQKFGKLGEGGQSVRLDPMGRQPLNPDGR